MGKKLCFHNLDADEQKTYRHIQEVMQAPFVSPAIKVNLVKDIELGMGAESNVLGEIRADLLLQLNLAKRTGPKSEDRVSVSSNEIRADLQQLDPGQREGADSEDTESVLAFNEQVQRDLDNLSRNCIERFKTKAVELWNRPWWPLPDSIALPLIAFTLMFMATLFADTMNALTKGEPFGKVSWELIKLPYTIGYGIYLLIKNGPSTPPIKLDRYVLPPYSNDTNNITYANCTLASGESIDCDTFNISSLSCIPLTVKLLNCSFPTNITYFLNKTVDRYFYASVESSSGSTEGGGEALQLIDFNGLQRLVYRPPLSRPLSCKIRGEVLS